MTDEDFERDKTHRRINYELCTAIDLTKLGMVLDEMMGECGMHADVANTYRMQASALLTSLRDCNNMAFGKAPQSPIR